VFAAAKKRRWLIQPAAFFYGSGFRLNGRLRRFASKLAPTLSFVWEEDPDSLEIKCGSELAREGA